MKKNYPLLIMAMFASCITSFAQVFVTVSGAGAQDGSSWANAYSGQQLPAVLSSWPGGPTDVWVAAGTYYPHATSRDSSFRLTSYVKMYGGFAGNETQLGQRDWNTNVTILSGDIGILNDISDNSFNVVRFENVSLCGIDGFTIQHGNANDVVNSWKMNGGGILNMSGGTNFSFSDPEIRNCKIINNVASGSGGGVANIGLTGTALCTLIGCDLTGNTADRYGGAIYSIGWPATFQLGQPGNSQLILYDCELEGNSVTSQFANSAGGAVCILNGGGVNGGGFTRCDFHDNFSSTAGGALGYSLYSQYTPNASNSNITLDSCSFVHNGIQGTAGMAISSISTEDLEANLTVKNTIFEDNYSALTSGSTAVVWFSNNGSNNTNNKFIGCRFLNNQRGYQGNVILSNSNPNTSGTIAGNDSLWVSNSFFYNNTMGDDIWVNGTNNTKHVTIVSNTTIYHDSTTTGSAASIRNNATNYNGIYPNTGSSVYVYNSILWHKVPYWGNSWQLEIMNEAQGVNITPMAAHSYVSNSVIFNCIPWPADYGVNGGGNNDDYPGFVDTANMDFHLVCNAYGVDHGNNMQMLPETFVNDVDGHARIFNNTVDVGAFETHVQDLIVIPTVTVNGMTITYSHNFAGLTDSVHWDFGDGDTSNTDNGTHTYNQTGTVTICLYVENSCGSDDTCFDITLTTSVAGLERTEDQVRLYPNPVSDILNIDIAENVMSITVYNNIGQQVIRTPGNSKRTAQVNVSLLPVGTYILEVCDEYGKTLHRRFLKL